MVSIYSEKTTDCILFNRSLYLLSCLLTCSKNMHVSNACICRCVSSTRFEHVARAGVLLAFLEHVTGASVSSAFLDWPQALGGRASRKTAEHGSDDVRAAGALALGVVVGAARGGARAPNKPSPARSTRPRCVVDAPSSVPKSPAVLVAHSAR